METDSSKEAVLKFLRNNPVMNISVTDGEKPMASVVLFAVDDDFTFYFATHDHTYKSKALFKHPKISFTVWNHHELLVQVDGVSTPIVGDDMNEPLEKIVSASQRVDDFWPPVAHYGEQNYIVYKIKPTWIRAMDLDRNTIKAGDTPYTIIDL